jgi:proline racemase
VPERGPGRGTALRVLHVRAEGAGLSWLETVETVDYHTAGEPFRIVTGGVPALEGGSILEKRRFALENLDAVRRFLVHEPRGHADMYGCFLTEPEDEGADLGVVFFHNAGYSTACGHGTIALVTWALEEGILPAEQPETRVVVDVPSGRLETVARVQDGAVRSVRFRNVPAFVEAESLLAEGLRADVAFGGAFYASIASPLPVQARNLPELIELGRAVKAGLEAQRSFVHPVEPELRDVYGVIFWERVGMGPPARQRNVTVFADGEVDRSPCGSGTSARLALLERAGELPRGEELIHEGIVGTEFRARVVGDADVAGRPAVITEVEGSAYRTGTHEFSLDPDDPLGEGFLLR